MITWSAKKGVHNYMAYGGENAWATWSTEEKLPCSLRSSNFNQRPQGTGSARLCHPFTRRKIFDAGMCTSQKPEYAVAQKPPSWRPTPRPRQRPFAWSWPKLGTPAH